MEWSIAAISGEVLRRSPAAVIFLASGGLVGYWWGSSAVDPGEVEQVARRMAIAVASDARRADLLFTVAAYRSMVMEANCPMDKELLMALDQIPIAFGPNPDVLVALGSLSDSNVPRGEAYRALISAMAEAAGLEDPPLTAPLVEITCQ